MTTEDSYRIARSTALMAANAYALIQVMSVLQAIPTLPKPMLALVLIPGFGLAAAYNMLQSPYKRWEEAASAWCVTLMVAIWFTNEWMF